MAFSLLFRKLLAVGRRRKREEEGGSAIERGVGEELHRRGVERTHVKHGLAVFFRLCVA
jgi:hypothetical protein